MPQPSPTLISFQQIGNKDIGHLSVGEIEEQLPFTPKRVYWVYGTPTAVTRGGHANKSNEQVIICVSGQVTIRLEDKSGHQFEFRLTSPNKGLHIPKLHWRSLTFSENAILFSICSDKFKESDYIRDIGEFRTFQE